VWALATLLAGAARAEEDDAEADDAGEGSEESGAGAAPEAAGEPLAGESPLQPPVAPAVELPSEPPAETPPVAAPIEPPEIAFHGLVGFRWLPYLKADPAAVDAIAEVRVAPRLTGRYRAIRGVAEVELRHDFFDPARNRVLIREAKAGLLVRGLRVEAGALLPRWGRMDVASPEDNVVAMDYEDLFFPEPLPVPGVLLGFARGPISVEGLLIPAFRPARFRHAPKSRWDITRSLPSTQSVPGPFGELTFANHYAIFEDAVLDGTAAQKGIEAGARATLALPNVDVGASFLATRDRLPTYTAFRTTNNTDQDGDGLPDHLSSSQAELTITPHHRRVFVPGVDVAGVVGPVVLRGEAAFFATEDPSHRQCLVDDPYVKYAFGADLALRNLVGDFGFSVRAQYNGDVTLPPGSRDGPDRFEDNLFFTDGDTQGNHDRGCQAIRYPADADAPTATDYETGFQASPEQRHPYQHGWYWNVNLELTRSLQVDVRGFVDIAGDALLIARLVARVLDRLELSAGGMAVLHVGADTIFTPYKDNHRLEFAADWRF
jgi:hypothetical protein